MNEYKYHCQHQAESFAKAIVPVPDDYPLKDGLPEDFRIRFKKLCELAKEVYMDMAKQPESYGLMLVDIESKDQNRARDCYRTIHRFADLLSRLCSSGELKNRQLAVGADAFKKAVKKGTGLVSGPVPKYELILSRLSAFGFVFSGFDGKPYGKKTEAFTVEYPDDPDMMDTIKTYCECYEVLKNKENRPETEYSLHEMHHRFYRFDYKITSDLAAIPTRQWVSDDAGYNGFPPELKMFSLAFYDESLKYKGIKFDGEYHYKSKRVARIQQGYMALGNPKFRLSVKLSKPDKYMDIIEKLPDDIQKPFEWGNCRYCDFQGATREHCKFRVLWNYDGIALAGCAHACFDFDAFDPEYAPVYWQLIEKEYNLTKL
ncbi:MAG: hypothetical protein FWF08_00915 [Oscillospiraceae bacterium]|nr:hypothetical protein [Oscillospiraceae bacterium]